MKINNISISTYSIMKINDLITGIRYFQLIKKHDDQIKEGIMPTLYIYKHQHDVQVLIDNDGNGALNQKIPCCYHVGFHLLTRNSISHNR